VIETALEAEVGESSSTICQMQRQAVAIVLDHTIVPVKDKITSAMFFAEILGLTVKLGQSDFAQVQINEKLIFDFADKARFDPKVQGHHYAFHVSDAEFQAILDKVKAKGLLFGSEPSNRTDGQLYSGRGRRGFYFEDPNGHLLEVMTVPETRS
jgi:catechol 2,3-dioxygenase-like lactoylglutathione lyase family enzyme